MGRAPLPHEREARHRGVGRHRQLAPDPHRRGGHGADGRPRRARPVRVEQVRRGENLGVVVVGGAPAAHAAAADDDRRVGEEEPRAVVVAGDGGRVEGGELEGGGVPELGVEDGLGVGEGDGVRLAADDEDLAVGEGDAVVKGTRVSHRADRDDGGLCPCRSDGDDVRVGRCVGVLVVWRASCREDFPGHSVVHDGYSTHRVWICSSKPCRCCAAAAGCSIPVHCAARSSLEDGAILPSKKPAMIILSVKKKNRLSETIQLRKFFTGENQKSNRNRVPVNSLCISSEHRRDRASRK